MRKYSSIERINKKKREKLSVIALLTCLVAIIHFSSLAQKDLAESDFSLPKGSHVVIATARLGIIYIHHQYVVSLALVTSGGRLVL